MKIFSKLLLIAFGVCVLFGSITYMIDASRISKNKKPIFVIYFDGYQDGGTLEYFGLGYKIFKYHIYGSYEDYNVILKDNYEIGSWFLKYNSDIENKSCVCIEKSELN